jgi:hypothetical protein
MKMWAGEVPVREMPTRRTGSNSIRVPEQQKAIDDEQRSSGQEFPSHDECGSTAP